jgi:hypothetical protein
MHEERCEVCGESVPRDVTRRKGRLRCCPRCAQPPVVAGEPQSANSFGYPLAEGIFRRYGLVLNGAERPLPGDAGTLRMRVATLTSH